MVRHCLCRTCFLGAYPSDLYTGQRGWGSLLIDFPLPPTVQVCLPFVLVDLLMYYILISSTSPFPLLSRVSQIADLNRDDAQGADEWVAPALQALGTSIYTLWPRLNGFDVGVPLHRMGIWDGLAEKAWQTERRHMCRRKGRKHTVRQ